MAQSLSRLNVHIIFHIKNPRIVIRPEDRKRLYGYINRIIINTECISIEIGGTSNHMHIFCVLSKNITLAKLVEMIKRNSSRWIKNIDPHYEAFAWQRGYGAFTVSASLCKKTIEYIKNQERHHRYVNFKEEYELFLKEYEVDYDESFLWED